MRLVESRVSLSLYTYRNDRIQRPFPTLLDVQRHLTREFCLSVGSSGSVSRLLLPVSWSPHTTRVERGSVHSPSHELLSRTDDLSSQHIDPRKHAAQKQADGDL